MPVTPVFLLSLPRSGSTFVQRVLAAHEGVATASEPWILLPLLEPLHEDLPVRSPFDAMTAGAITDFLAETRGGPEAYRRGVREMALGLYAEAAPSGARFFVDKTPPYHLIVDEIVATFPDARFVFLWRNPLSVLASNVETLMGGEWKTTEHRGDLFAGLDHLTASFARHRDRAYGVRYEDLIAGEAAWRDLARYIGLDFEPAALQRFAGVRLTGRLGDPTGVRRYDAVSSEPLTKWRGTVNTPVRRAWCRRWLRWIGAERLALMGYDLTELQAGLDGLNAEGGDALADVRRLAIGTARELVSARLPGPREPSSVRRLLSARG